MMKTHRIVLLVWGMFMVSSVAPAHPEFGKTLEFGEHIIYYEVRGDAEKTLVFLHGWTASLESWKFQLDAFPAYRVIALDFPGNGHSSKLETAAYTMEVFADAVHAVLVEEQVSQAVFFGHSMGFAVAEVVAQKYPEMCVGIGSIDGAHFVVPDDDDARQAWIEGNRGFAESLNEETGREAFLNMLFLPDTPRILREEVLAMSRQVPLSIGRAMIAGVERDLPYWALRTMQIPCLAVYSPVYQLPDEYQQDFRAMYLQVEYHEIDHVSHFLMLEIPYVINQLIHDYLEHTLYQDHPKRRED